MEEAKKEPVGGASRFTEMVLTHFVPGKTIVTFGGDCFSPSLLASITMGEHMIPFLNNMHINASCVGNHDFDFGFQFLVVNFLVADQFNVLWKKCNFAWLASNMIDKTTGKIYGNCQEYLCLQLDSGLKVGLIGIIEEDWISTLVGKIAVEDVQVLDGVKVATSLAGK